SRKAALELARANRKRGEELAPGGGISKEELDIRRQTVKADEANVEQALQKVYADRVALGLPAQSKKGHDLAEVPPDLDQNSSTVRQALANTIQSAAQLGYVPTSWDATPEQATEEFYRKDQALLNLRYTRLRAPFPGVVVKRYLHLGDFASPGV